MRNLLKFLGLAVVMAFAPFATVVAEPVTAPTIIDWQEIEDIMQGPGDHVVGEELCAKPR